MSYRKNKSLQQVIYTEGSYFRLELGWPFDENREATIFYVDFMALIEVIVRSETRVGKSDF